MRKTNLIFMFVMLIFMFISCKTDQSKNNNENAVNDGEKTDTLYTDQDVQYPDISDPDSPDTDVPDTDVPDTDVPDTNISDEDTPDEFVEQEDMSHCKPGEVIVVKCDSEKSDLQKLICDEDFEWVKKGDCYEKPYIGDMVKIPEGTFLMGCDESMRSSCKNNETPLKLGFLKEYEIDVYQVTVDQFKKCVDEGFCEQEMFLSNSQDRRCSYGLEGKEMHPMNCISWFGALSYCTWAGKRLPTEAEWEKGARGRYGRLYPWGDVRATCDYAVMDHRGVGCGKYNRTIFISEPSTFEVGSKLAGVSPYGLFDMAGNVWEWVDDSYDLSDNKDISILFSDNEEIKVIRGGCSESKSPNTLMTFRRSYDLSTNKLRYTGFRCAR